MGQRKNKPKPTCKCCKSIVPIRERVAYVRIERIAHPYSSTVCYYCEDCWATHIALLLGMSDDPRCRADRPIRHPTIRGRTLNRKLRI